MDGSFTQAWLEKLIGSRVSVYVGPFERNNFNACICVTGTLRQHSKNIRAFQIVASGDDGSYSYFSTSMVRTIRVFEGLKVKCACSESDCGGSADAVIQIELPRTAE